MVNCLDAIKKVISDTMNDFDQPLHVKQQYEKLFENRIKNNCPDSDIKRMIENIKLEDD